MTQCPIGWRCSAPNSRTSKSTTMTGMTRTTGTPTSIEERMVAVLTGGDDGWGREEAQEFVSRLLRKLDQALRPEKPPTNPAA
jgi:hypothetical protein